jgi:hypothetical protein
LPCPRRGERVEARSPLRMPTKPPHMVRCVGHARPRRAPDPRIGETLRVSKTLRICVSDWRRDYPYSCRMKNTYAYWIPNPYQRRGERWLLSLSKHVRPYACRPTPRTLIAAPDMPAPHARVRQSDRRLSPQPVTRRAPDPRLRTRP